MTHSRTTPLPRHRSDATLMREVRELAPGRGISQQRLGGCARLVRRFPERGEEVLDVLAPHMAWLGHKALNSFWSQISQVRPDLLASLVDLVVEGEQAVKQLTKLATDIHQPQAYLLCRARLVALGHANLAEFDGHCARHGVIHVFYGPQQGNAFALLDAVLAQPGAHQLMLMVGQDDLGVAYERLDWVAGVMAQAQLQTPPLGMMVQVLDRLEAGGITVAQTGQGRRAMEIVARQHKHQPRMREALDLLLDRGADWHELKLGGPAHRDFWAQVRAHPRVRSWRLGEAARRIQVSEHMKSSGTVPTQRRSAM